jgi:hypothetical protein
MDRTSIEIALRLAARCGRSRRNAVQGRNTGKAGRKLSARGVLDVLQRQQRRYGSQRKAQQYRQKRVVCKSYREEERRSTGLHATRTSLNTLLAPQGAQCWTYSPDAGSVETAGLLDFYFTVIARSLQLHHCINWRVVARP